eukprot:356058-Chlamydomonas_euryale.AAC.6
MNKAFEREAEGPLFNTPTSNTQPTLCWCVVKTHTDRVEGGRTDRDGDRSGPCGLAGNACAVPLAGVNMAVNAPAFCQVTAP